MSEIDSMHERALLKHMEAVERKERWFVFGPKQRKDFQDLYDALNDLRIGYFAAEYKGEAPKKKKNNSSNLILTYVGNKQADKLSKALAELGVESEQQYASQIFEKEQALKEKQEAFLAEQQKREEAEKEKQRKKKRDRLKKAREAKKSKTAAVSKTTRKTKTKTTKKKKTKSGITAKTRRWSELLKG